MGCLISEGVGESSSASASTHSTLLFRYVYSPHGRYKRGFERKYSFNSSTAPCGCERVAPHPIAFHGIKHHKMMYRAYCQAKAPEIICMNHQDRMCSSPMCNLS